MHLHLLNTAQEKLLLYRIQLSDYDVINFNDMPNFVHVWAPHLPEFLQHNIDRINYMPFYRAWYDKDKIITPVENSDYSPQFLNQRAEDILYNLPQFPNRHLTPNFKDNMACYVGEVYHRESDFTRMVATTTGKDMFADAKDLVFDPQNFKLTLPADMHTQGVEKTFLTYQRELFKLGLTHIPAIGTKYVYPRFPPISRH